MDELWAVADAFGWPMAAAFAGLLAGGVANSMISRLPRETGRFRAWMRCDACGRRKSPLDAVPIVGWLLKGGRCRSCRAHISTQEPVVEAVNAVLWLLIAGANPPTARSLSTMVFVTALLTLSLIDLEHHVLPDLITLPGILLGVVATLLPGWPVSLLDSALSAGVGYFAMMALAKGAEAYYREEAIGQGDWKMVAMLGSFMGPSSLIIALLIANISGALVGLLLVLLLGREGKQKLPLGTFLGASGILVQLTQIAW